MIVPIVLPITFLQEVSKKGTVLQRLFNCNQFLEVYFACAKLGVIFVPLNWRLAPQELEYQLCDSGSCFLVVHGASREKVDPIRSKVPVQKGNFCVVESRGVLWEITL